MYRLDCANPREEATAIALILREALETPGKTAALVTPDRDLAQRVAEQMRRWGVEIDDSAGVPLGQAAVGRFLRLVERPLHGADRGVEIHPERFEHVRASGAAGHRNNFV